MTVLYYFPMQLLFFAVWFLTWFTAGVPTDKKTHLTGIYDLVAVLTHKGRSADSGHYVGWVKQESGQYSRLNYLLVTMEGKFKFWPEILVFGHRKMDRV